MTSLRHSSIDTHTLTVTAFVTVLGVTYRVLWKYGPGPEKEEETKTDAGETVTRPD